MNTVLSLSFMCQVQHYLTSLLVLFLVGTTCYKRNPPQGNVIVKVFGCITVCTISPPFSHTELQLLYSYNLRIVFATPLPASALRSKTCRELYYVYCNVCNQRAFVNYFKGRKGNKAGFLNRASDKYDVWQLLY